MLLLNSEKFKSEYANFASRIERVTDQDRKNELERSLKQLVNQIKKIDNYHQDLVFTHKLPESIDSDRTEVANIRKKIIKLLEFWEKTVAASQNKQ